MNPALILPHWFWTLAESVWVVLGIFILALGLIEFADWRRRRRIRRKTGHSR